MLTGAGSWVDQYLGIPWTGGENPTKVRLEVERNKQAVRNTQFETPQPQVVSQTLGYTKPLQTLVKRRQPNVRSSTAFRASGKITEINSMIESSGGH